MTSPTRRAFHAARRAAERVPEGERRPRMVAARRTFQLSRRELAERVGITEASIARAERGGLLGLSIWHPVVDWCAGQGLDLVTSNLECAAADAALDLSFMLGAEADTILEDRTSGGGGFQVQKLKGDYQGGECAHDGVR